MRRNFPVVFRIAAFALVAWLRWPLAIEFLRAGIPAVDDHRFSHLVWLTDSIFISAVFISLGIKHIGSRMMQADSSGQRRRLR